MLKKMNDILTGIPAAILSGFFLLLHAMPHLLEIFGVTGISGELLPFDPAWVTVMISGIPILYLALQQCFHRTGISRISSALLISIAMIAAIAIGDLFAAGEVAWILSIGEILEDKTTERAQRGLKKLMSLVPAQARRIVRGKEERIPADQINEGDLLRVLPGETIPVDGVIVSGETTVDQSVMTGESLPMDKAAGDRVFCGTINRFGCVDIRAVRVGENSSLQKLIRMVREAEKNKAPMAGMADRAASFLVPSALLIAVLTGIITGNIVRAVTVLVVFCPCSLVLAVPTAVMAAIGQAARHGVIIKSGAALEKMGRADTIAFDKTGTLTMGCLHVCDILSFDAAADETALLSLAASVETKSGHPLGQAIVACAKKRNVPILSSGAFRMVAGKGVGAEIENKIVLCGSEAFLNENGIFLSEEIRRTDEKLCLQGKATVLTAWGAKCVGIFGLLDVLRAEAKETVEGLHRMNMGAVLLTGDQQTTAEHVARQVGIDAILAQLLPEDKVNSILALQKEGKRVCMVGDGVNDAPALKAADVGVSMGRLGSDIAAEAADIVLMGDDLSGLLYLKWLSKAAARTVRLSICLSMGINLLGIGLSVLGVLDPTTGALVHNVGSCAVLLFAALLYDRKGGSSFSNYEERGEGTRTN